MPLWFVYPHTHITRDMSIPSNMAVVFCVSPKNHPSYIPSSLVISELNIWNDNIQSFRPETSEALVLVFHAVRTSVSVPRMQTVRGPYVSFSPLTWTVARPV